MFAIKGGLMDRMGNSDVQIWINDPDQDTSLASWLLVHHKAFSGTNSHPVINRILTLTDRWDITGGAYPTSLDDEIVEQHSWIFEPYTELRTSGTLSSADSCVIMNCLESVHSRLDRTFAGRPGRKKLRTDHEILFSSPHGYFVVNETGGNEARYDLFSRGMNAFVSLVATRPDGRIVYSIGRRSRYIDFPVQRIFDALNDAEGFIDPQNRWGGSDIIGGSPRIAGSSLSWTQVRDVVEETIQNENWPSSAVLLP